MQVLHSSKRIIIKVGSALLTRQDTGRINHYWLAGLAKDIIALRQEGKEVCVLSSGAVALGRGMLGLKHRPLVQSEKQAAAACGQMILMRGWEEVFREDEVRVGQILLTIEDSDSRRRYLNARNTLNTLLGLGVVPIINENDTVATRTIRVGDNDRLAARVAQMIGADVLILLSDIDGLYTADPTKHPHAEFIPEVKVITSEVRSYAAPASTNVGTGGMITKIEAAAIATASGCHTILAQGHLHKPVTALRQGGRHTLFVAQTTPVSARKEWIAGALSPQGVLYVDAGAVKALGSGKSLLPVGVSAVSGEFQRGDAVLIKDKVKDITVAKGLVCYNYEELGQIIGLQSAKIVEKLGYDRGDVVVHRDDMVML